LPLGNVLCWWICISLWCWIL